MNKLTYQQAYNKIIEAYFKDEIQPFDPRFCFCGTLCSNSDQWYGDSIFPPHHDFMGYKGIEFSKMERALFDGIHKSGDAMFDEQFYSDREPEYEQKLFNGMSAALEVLKEIHRERGEDVDNYVPEKKFVKRELGCNSHSS